MKAIHNLSKDARYQIISLLLEKRSKKELAEELGLTPAAITKFLSQVTHPSDETIEKAINIADEEERKRIVRIILNDLIDSIKGILEDYDEYIDTEDVKELKEILEYLESKKEVLSLRLV